MIDTNVITVHFPGYDKEVDNSFQIKMELAVKNSAKANAETNLLVALLEGISGSGISHY
ncbi:MAG: hypothetical protein QF704_01830 [Anaerolineales bacterium]|nr:hypothetical protein [Anaerolineales bacterium]